MVRLGDIHTYSTELSRAWQEVTRLMDVASQQADMIARLNSRVKELERTDK